MMRTYSLMIVIFVLVIVSCRNAPLQAGKVQNPKQSKTLLKQYVSLLGNESYAIRKKAEDKLVEAGKIAVPLLAAALKDPDMEMRCRAASALLRISRRGVPEAAKFVNKEYGMLVGALTFINQKKYSDALGALKDFRKAYPKSQLLPQKRCIELLSGIARAFDAGSATKIKACLLLSELEEGGLWKERAQYEAIKASIEDGKLQIAATELAKFFDYLDLNRGQSWSRHYAEDSCRLIKRISKGPIKSDKIDKMLARARRLGATRFYYLISIEIMLERKNIEKSLQLYNEFKEKMGISDEVSSLKIAQALAAKKRIKEAEAFYLKTFSESYPGRRDIFEKAVAGLAKIGSSKTPKLDAKVVLVVKDADGNPVPGVKVMPLLEDVNRQNIGGTTDGKGETNQSGQVSYLFLPGEYKHYGLGWMSVPNFRRRSQLVLV